VPDESVEQEHSPEIDGDMIVEDYDDEFATGSKTSSLKGSTEGQHLSESESDGRP